MPMFALIFLALSVVGMSKLDIMSEDVDFVVNTKAEI
jgi:hypothetical protein